MIKMNLPAILSIVFFAIFATDLIDMVGEYPTIKNEIYTWWNSLRIMMFLVAIYLFGMTSKFKRDI